MPTQPDFSVTGTGQQPRQQWIRQSRLTFINSVGIDTVHVDNLRIRFRVQAATVNTLASAEITVYNLAPQTAEKIFYRNNESDAPIQKVNDELAGC
jgi:hypothetical protein